jgi:putative DNA methylase
MARAFAACHAALRPEGRLVIVFAHKQPDAWETLVAAIIKSGFVVDGSWPIQTEQASRMRAIGSAALSSSVWLVCRKRDPMCRAGWDTQVIKEMESNIVQRLRDFWDAGVRGPDFVWAATGPALEAYSRYPAVKKASEPGVLMGVDEFLRHVRRIVVDFVVGRVLTHGEAEAAVSDQPLDDVTTYYLLHRNDFGLKEAPAGPCILYMVSCGLPERDLVDQYELLARGGRSGPEAADNEADEDTDEEEAEAATSGGAASSSSSRGQRVAIGLWARTAPPVARRRWSTRCTS